MVKQAAKAVSKFGPCFRPKPHQVIERRRLTGNRDRSRQKICLRALVKVKEMRSNSNAQMLVPIDLKYPIRQVAQWKIGGWIIGRRQPALISGNSSLSHGGMIPSMAIFDHLSLSLLYRLL